MPQSNRNTSFIRQLLEDAAHRGLTRQTAPANLVEDWPEHILVEECNLCRPGANHGTDLVSIILSDRELRMRGSVNGIEISPAVVRFDSRQDAREQYASRILNLVRSGLIIEPEPPAPMAQRIVAQQARVASRLRAEAAGNNPLRTSLAATYAEELLRRSSAPIVLPRAIEAPPAPAEDSTPEIDKLTQPGKRKLL